MTQSFLEMARRILLLSYHRVSSLVPVFLELSILCSPALGICGPEYCIQYYLPHSQQAWAGPQTTVLQRYETVILLNVS